MEIKENVRILYSAEQELPAFEVYDYLKKEHHAQDAENIGKYNISLYVDGCFCKNTIIVFISDEAVADAKWQKEIKKSLGDWPSARLIPVGKICDADYHDPNVVPEAIEELNFISIDQDMLYNIWDVMVTDTEFFNHMNHIQMEMYAWKMSHESEIFLMSGLHTIRKNLKYVNQRLVAEKEASFRKKLVEMKKYLLLSRKQARKEFWSSMGKRLERIAYIIAAVAIIFMLLNVMPYMRRASSAVSLLNNEMDVGSAPVIAVRLLDGLQNPFLNNTLKNSLLNELEAQLNVNWCNNPTGIFYKWMLYAARLDENTRYLWTAGENGQLVKWDTYKGDIASRIDVSDSPLISMDYCNNSAYMAVIDMDGRLFIVNSRTGGIMCCQKMLEFQNMLDVEIKMSSDGSNIVAYDGRTIYGIANDVNLQILWQQDEEKIMCAEVLENETVWVAYKDGVMHINCTDVDGTTSSQKADIAFADYCTCDIRNGKMLLADQNNQIVIMNLREKTEIEPMGLRLSEPLLLSFVSENIIAYHDRNTGTHIYDLKNQLDLGSVLNLFPVITRLHGSGTTVVGYYSGRYVTEDISTLVSQDNFDASEALEQFDDIECIGKEGGIGEIKVRNRYMITMEVKVDGENETVLIDGTNKHSAGTAQKKERWMTGIPENYRVYNRELVKFTGEPTVVGITGNGDTALIGASDGSFFEIYVNNGGSLLCAYRQIPSHSPIVHIYRTEDGYILEDSAKMHWWVRSGSAAVENDDLVGEVKERFHFSLHWEWEEWLSKTLIKELELTESPDNKRKEWE